MSNRTITIPDEVRERLEEHRHPEHNTWGDTLEGLMAVAPSVEELEEDGCARCGERLHGSGPIEKRTAYIHSFHHSAQGVESTYSSAYCSRECLVLAREKADKYGSCDPDKVVAGGVSQYRVEFEAGHFHIDGHTKSFGIEIPGAFTGSPDHSDEEYAYVGEPIYIKNWGEWVHAGVISDIIHEEGSTTVEMEADFAYTNAHHPDPGQRDKAFVDFQRRGHADCPGCETPVGFPAAEPKSKCPDCGASLEGSLTTNELRCFGCATLSEYHPLSPPKTCTACGMDHIYEADTDEPAFHLQ